MRWIWASLFILMITGCGKTFTSGIGQNFTSESNLSEMPPEDSPVISDGSTFKPSICSDLSFENVTWPQNISEVQLNAFALAMNISGSFEGPLGWANISNNFDGQGISLGLFNQNLGQGSLQPLFITLRDRQSAKWQEVYSPSQAASLQSMLTAWGTSSDGIQLTKATNQDAYQKNTSALDDESLLSSVDFANQEILSKASNARNQASVDWSVQTVYTGTTGLSFRPEWRSALQKMAASPEYITLQVAAARAIHLKAVGLMEKYGYRQLRSYLFLFDIVVQNGGITTSIENQYLAWAQANPSATEITQLRRLLELRLTIVRAEYVEDVRARKTAIINGTGVVHKSARNFPAEYCTPSWATLVR